MRPAPSFDVVVPTVGRPSLAALLDALERGRGPLPDRIVIVDDRPDPSDALPGMAGLGRLGPRIDVERGPQAGPAAARNRGWRTCVADWIAFLDDDVVPDDGWLESLAADLAELAPDVAGSQGRITVPRPRRRHPRDWERNVAGLETARWATADMAYRRSVLQEVGGFDERFPRAYREDADLGLRVVAAGYRIARGRRHVVHPVRPAGRWVSLRLQAGNRDDALMHRLHGRGWRRRAQAPAGRRPFHLAVTAAGLIAVGGLIRQQRSLAITGAAAWITATSELAWRRIAPGPRDRDEVVTMLLTSALLSPLATWHWLAGVAHASRLAGARVVARPEAVFLDRDGTLVADVPYNGDPSKVVPMPGARDALDTLRAAGIPTAVISNQSGVGRGLMRADQVHAVNERVKEILGPLGPWLVCMHHPDDGCDCRKPAAGLVLRAADALGVDPRRCAVIGDIGADVEAGRAAGARSVLVPTPATRREEIEAADEVAADLPSAVALLLGPTR